MWWTYVLGESKLEAPKDSFASDFSSWVSHLPSSLKPRTMVGYGLNAEELARNSHLTKNVVRDLNAFPRLSEVGNETVDVVLCNVSVDYLVKPTAIFCEMRRVLKDRGTAHMAFSNRYFPTKVIKKWIEMDDGERRKWVGGYFWASGGWTDVEEVILREGSPGIMGMGAHDPLYVVRATKA